MESIISRMFVSAVYIFCIPTFLILGGICVFDMYLRPFSAGDAESWNINCDSFLFFSGVGVEGSIFIHLSWEFCVLICV